MLLCNSNAYEIDRAYIMAGGWRFDLLLTGCCSETSEVPGFLRRRRARSYCGGMGASWAWYGVITACCDGHGSKGARLALLSL